MERRAFIKSSLLASTSLLVPHFLQASASGIALPSDKKLVVIQLSGGNDGLNTVVPFRDDNYYRLRPILGQQKNSVLTINDSFGLHQQLPNFYRLYQEGMVCIVNGVGYPNPNRSHFRALDIWHSASDADKYISSGWLGRYVDNYCDSVAPAIEVDDSLSLAIKGDNYLGLAVSDPNKFYRTSMNPFFDSLGAAARKQPLDNSNLDYLYKTMIDTQSAASYIHEKSKQVSAITTFPATQLGRKLKQTAQFINERLDTRVYYVDHGGFDTHAGQINAQSRLLGQLDEALAAFVKELNKGGSMDDTLILVFSEFGRRVKENASGGTDHGTANSIFLISNQLKTPGMVGMYPSLSTLDNNGDLIFTTDFREVYATILDRWLGASSPLILGRDYGNLNLI